MGRDAQLATLEQVLPTLKVLVLVGQGGIGKTSLAVKLLDAVGVDRKTQTLMPDCVYERVIYLRVQEGMGFDAVVQELAQGLGLTLREFQTPEQTIAQLMAALQERRCLVVLDNLEDALQGGRAISPELGKLLYGFVCCSHQSQVMITSREKPLDLVDPRDPTGIPDPFLVRLESVEGISLTAGIELLRKYQLQDSEADLRWVVERVGGHVLLLTLLAKRAQGKPGFLRKNPQLVTRDARPILQAQLGRQSQAARELLKRMCVLRVGINLEGLTFLRLFQDDKDEAGRFWMATRLKEPTALLPEELEQTEALVQQLANASLVEVRYDPQQCEDFFSLQRVIGEFLQAEFSVELPGLMQSVYAFYRSGKAVEDPKTLDDLRPVLEAQHFAFQLGNYDEAWRVLKWQLEDYLQPWGHWSLLKDLYEKILPHLDQDEIPRCLGQIGILHRGFGNWDTAEGFFQRSLKLREELGDRSGMASSWGLLGDIERNRGNWDRAEELYQRSLIEREALGDRSGIATSIGCLGETELGRGNLDAAETLLNDALAQMQTLGMTWHIAETNSDLAQLQRRRGNLDRAQHHYSTAHQLFTRLGALKDLERLEKEWVE